MCVNICVCGGCLDKYISVATWPPKQKFLATPLYLHMVKFALKSCGILGL